VALGLKVHFALRTPGKGDSSRWSSEMFCEIACGMLSRPRGLHEIAIVRGTRDAGSSSDAA
jgi:hypothetical protein